MSTEELDVSNTGEEKGSRKPTTMIELSEFGT